jgi:hypothetical protein
MAIVGFPHGASTALHETTAERSAQGRESRIGNQKSEITA